MGSGVGKRGQEVLGGPWEGGGGFGVGLGGWQGGGGKVLEELEEAEEGYEQPEEVRVEM